MTDARIHILGSPIDALTMQQTLDRIRAAIDERRRLHHVVVNAAKIVKMSRDAQLSRSVTESDLINADGQGVVWAARVLGQPLPERVAGIDLMQSLVGMAHEHGYRCFFFGAKEEIVASVVKTYSDRYSPDVVAGYRNGYFKPEDEPEIVRAIAESGAQILFVAISSPTKENFLHRHRDALDVPFIMGVGGSFDVVAGKVSRAPRAVQQAGMEWAWRLGQEPGRLWRRYLGDNSRFLLLVLKERLGRPVRPPR